MTPRDREVDVAPSETISIQLVPWSPDVTTREINAAIKQAAQNLLEGMKQ